MRSFYHLCCCLRSLRLARFSSSSFLRPHVFDNPDRKNTGKPVRRLRKNLSSGCLKIFCRHTGGKGCENYIKHSVAPL